MRICVRSWWTTKAGNAPEEYEDAFWPVTAGEREVRGFRAAVADGATETSFSGVWARMLVRAYAQGRLSERRLRRGIPELAQRWRQEVGTRPLPWYAEEKLRSGAFAAVVGLHLMQDEQDHLRWRALAVGDSCLFRMRGHELLTAYPVTNARAFTNRPHLLSTNPNGRLPSLDCTASGECHAGDVFYLMTDALAHWFLSATEQGQQPSAALDELAAMHTDAAFNDWINWLRAERLIRNDDVTFMRVEVAKPSEPAQGPDPALGALVNEKSNEGDVRQTVEEQSTEPRDDQASQVVEP